MMRLLLTAVVACVCVLAGCTSARMVPEAEPLAPDALSSIRGLVAYLSASGVHIEAYRVDDYSGILRDDEQRDSIAVLSFKYEVDRFEYPAFNGQPRGYEYYPACYVASFRSSEARENRDRYGGTEANTFIEVYSRFRPPFEFNRFVVTCSDESRLAHRALASLEAYAEDLKRSSTAP